jgi:hypothetical protein
MQQNITLNEKKQRKLLKKNKNNMTNYARMQSEKAQENLQRKLSEAPNNPNTSNEEDANEAEENSDDGPQLQTKSLKTQNMDVPGTRVYFPLLFFTLKTFLEKIFILFKMFYRA